MNKTTTWIAGRKPCPYCAYETSSIIESKVDEGKPNEHMEYAAMCRNCGAFGPNELSRIKAHESWNMRRKEFPKPYIPYIE